MAPTIGDKLTQLIGLGDLPPNATLYNMNGRNLIIKGDPEHHPSFKPLRGLTVIIQGVNCDFNTHLIEYHIGHDRYSRRVSNDTDLYL